MEYFGIDLLLICYIFANGSSYLFNWLLLIKYSIIFMYISLYIYAYFDFTIEL